MNYSWSDKKRAKKINKSGRANLSPQLSPALQSLLRTFSAKLVQSVFPIKLAKLTQFIADNYFVHGRHLLKCNNNYHMYLQSLGAYYEEFKVIICIVGDHLFGLWSKRITRR